MEDYLNNGRKRKNTNFPKTQMLKFMNSQKYRIPEITRIKRTSKILKYLFLDDEEKKPVIINAKLFETEEEELIEVQKVFKSAIEWGLCEIKRTRPSMHMHKIILEQGIKETQ